MKTLSFLLMALCLTMPRAGLSQTPEASQADDSQNTVIVDVNRVLVNFPVVDNKGKFITNLKKEDFRIYEDGELQTITNFTSETDLPLTIALLVDVSGSIRDKLRFEQEAAIEFFYSTLTRGKDKGMVISFDSAPEVLQEFTDDPEKLADAVRRLRAGGGTALYDAVYVAILQRLALEEDESRKVIIVISDGDDNSSRVSLTETLEAAQKHNVAVYGISTNQSAYFGNSSQERGDKTLRRLTEETGGFPFFPFKIEELASNFQNIHEELRSQYTIEYSPTNTTRDGAFREIRIDVADKRYKARARKGYFASSETIGQ